MEKLRGKPTPQKEPENQYVGYFFHLSGFPCYILCAMSQARTKYGIVNSVKPYIEYPDTYNNI